nr:TetR/AcrR family transcriptional regulator [Paraburkholderia terrae]MDW3661878.1 TetR/AcrR family transcriptional regulator [Paraburkholderia terrae]
MRERNGTTRAASAVQPAVSPAAKPQQRGLRRKQQTRTRLLEAALRLMATSGMDGVAINEITEAADVGFGSFYNHFESKEAIYTALIERVFEEYADMLDLIARDASDPAEVIAVAVRHTLRRARREPLWGHFLIREGLSARALSRGLGQRLLRDTQRGIAGKRFALADPFIGFLSLKGTLLAAIAAELHLAVAGCDAPKAPGVPGEHFAERMAAAVLHMLGLGCVEAEAIASRPLPELGRQGKDRRPQRQTVLKRPVSIREVAGRARDCVDP